MKFKTAVLLCLALGIGFARAEEAETKATPKEKSSLSWKGYVGLGMTAGPTSDATIKYHGQSLTTVTSNDKGSFGGSGEVEAVFHPVFGASLHLDYGTYKYKDGSPGDTSLSLMVVPKARAKSGIWAGLGLGLNRTGIGEPHSTQGTTSVTYDESTLTSFILSPRVGYDYEIQPGLTLGAYAAYNTMSTSTTVSVVDVSQSINDKLALDFTRKWWDFVVRVGFDL